MSKTILNVANNYFGTKLYENLNKIQLDMGYSVVNLVILNEEHSNEVVLNEFNNIVILEKKLVSLACRLLPPLRVLFYWKTIKKLSNDGFDIVHSHSLHSNGSLGYFISRKSNAKHIISVRNVDLNFAIKKLKYLHIWYKKLLTSSFNIQVLNFAAKEKIEMFSDVSSIVIHNPIDKFWLSGYGEEKLRSLSTIKILCLGQICKNKNQLALIRLINRSERDITLTLCGEVLEENYDKQLRQEARFKLDFLGHIQDKKELRNIILEHDFKFLLSKTETFGLSLVEAGLCGLPVVHTKGQAIDGYIKDQSMCYPYDLAKNTSIDEVLDKIGTVENNKVQRSFMLCFSKERLVEKMELLYG